MLKLQFKDKRQEPVWVVEKVFSIGSAPGNNLVIADDSVSGQHARLLLEDGHFVLYDCGSSNGTFVNGQRINQRQVGSNDCIRLGQVDLEILDPWHGSDGAPYWALVANASWLAGQEFPLTPKDGEELLVGRGSHCDVVFPGTHLSREHARILVGEEGIRITDLDSANGTYLNDQKVTGTVTAKAGDRLRLDIYSFIVLGPGMERSGMEGPGTALTPSTTDGTSDSGKRPSTDAPKRWKTRPTSPGNREESASPRPSPTPVVLTALLLAVLVGAVIYFALT